MNQSGTPARIERRAFFLRFFCFFVAKIFLWGKKKNHRSSRHDESGVWKISRSKLEVALLFFLKGTEFTPTKFNSSPPNSYLPKSKGLSSNHPFSRAMLNLGGVFPDQKKTCEPGKNLAYFP